MNYEEMNKAVRDICKNLMIDGCKKTKLCRVILGQHNQPMFEGFVGKDKNFGIQVLSRMMDNFDYDLMVVPIKRNQKEQYQEFLNYVDEQFLEDISTKIKEYVEADQLHNSARPNEQINLAVNNILETILPDEEGENENE